MSKFRFAALSVIAASVLVGCEKKAELHLYTWSDYIAPEVIAGFEEANNCQVVVDTFESNEQMYAKLKAGGTGYDIIMPSSYIVATMAREGLIQELDHTKIPNVKANFDARFASQILDPTFKYNVPYTVTYTGLMYLKDMIPEGADVNSWTILANPALRGRISLLDDIREVIGAGLMANGFKGSSTNPEEIEKAIETVISWRPNCRKFDAEGYKVDVAGKSTWVGHGYSTDATQVIVGDDEDDQEGRPRPDIGFALPREGFSIAFDEMVLAKDAPNTELAYKFINYIYEGEVAKANMEFIMGPCPVKPGIDALDPEYRQLIVLDDETLSHGQVIEPIDDSAQDLYNNAWDRIRATDAK